MSYADPQKDKECQKRYKRTPAAKKLHRDRMKRAYWENPDKFRKRAREARDPVKAKSNRLKRSYGITLDAWNELFESQGKRCASCGSIDPLNARGWATDHDHFKKKSEPGFLRGILCGPCNSTLGHAKEDTLRLANVIRYLHERNNV